MYRVLLISLDTLRADVAYSGRFPNIERLRRRGTTFANTVASAPLTPPSHASVLSGRQPYKHGLRHLFREKIDANTPLIAEQFQRSGYRTGAIVSCPGLNRWYGFSRGFDHFDDEIPRLPDGSDPLETVDVKLRGTALKRANIVADRAITWLEKEGDKDFFLFLHFFDAHWPYEAPEDVLDVRNPYEGEVAFMDHNLGRVLDHMEARGLLDDTFLVLFSDHGEDLHGWYPNDKAGPRGHPEEEGHGALLYDQTQMVALVVCKPGEVPAGKTVDRQVRLIDIAPTILEQCGMPQIAPMDGASLRPVWTGAETGHRPAYFETFYRDEINLDDAPAESFKPLAGVRLDNRWKVIWQPCGMSATVQVLDLANDQLEWAPVLNSSPPLVEPNFDPAPALDLQALDWVCAHLRSVSPGWEASLRGLAERVIRDRPDLGLAVDGGLAEGRFDTHSDLDLSLVFSTRAPRAGDLHWIRATMGELGARIADFTADHVGLPNLLVSFLDVDGEIIKIDINCVRVDAVPARAIMLKPPLCASVATPPASPPAFDLDLAWNRLVGWTWVGRLKIERGEKYAAEELITGIRADILFPALRQSLGAPNTGTHRLETVLNPAQDRALAATFPRDLSRAALMVALDAAVEFGERLLTGLKGGAFPGEALAMVRQVRIPAAAE